MVDLDAPPTEFSRWRERCGLTQEDAAERLGVSTSWIRLLERGRRYDRETPVEPDDQLKALMEKVEKEVVSGEVLQRCDLKSIVAAADKAGLDVDTIGPELLRAALLQTAGRLIERATMTELRRLSGAMAVIEDLIGRRERDAQREKVDAI